jgi:hypothetical protein
MKEDSEHQHSSQSADHNFDNDGCTYDTEREEFDVHEF